jgi:hypothetical protein
MRQGEASALARSWKVDEIALQIDTKAARDESHGSLGHHLSFFNRQYAACCCYFVKVDGGGTLRPAEIEQSVHAVFQERS